MVLTHRKVQFEDIADICTFSENAQELYWCFPTARYPLTVEQLTEAIETRYESTVILANNKVAGFCNFPIVENNLCRLGNVMVQKDYRQQGVASYLIKTMCDIGFEKYQVPEMQVSCFNDNLNGLLLYNQLEFRPFDIEKRINYDNQINALIHFRLYREEFYKKHYNKILFTH